MRNGVLLSNRQKRLRSRYFMYRSKTCRRYCFFCHCKFRPSSGKISSRFGYIKDSTLSESIGSNSLMANNNDKVTWTQAATTQLIQFLYDYALEHAPRQPDKQEYENWAVSLSKHFDKPLTVVQVKGKRERLKKEYDVFQDLKTHTGFGWDNTTRRVVCDQGTWAAYVKKHPKANKFRDAGLEHDDLLDVIFGRNQATGTMLYGSGSASFPTQEPIDVDDDVDVDEEGHSSDVPQVQPNHHPPPMRSATNIAAASRAIGKKQRKGKGKHQSDIAKALDCLNVISSSVSGGNKTVSSQEVSGRTKAQEAQNILHEMSVSDDIYNRALDLFAANITWAEYFIDMEPARRHTWLFYKVYPSSSASAQPNSSNNIEDPYFSDTPRIIV